MSGIEVKLIEHSISKESGKPIMTFQLKYHRYILSELNTHRMLSRNSSSSRAIPIAKTIEQVRSQPAIPIHWGKNIPGMQATEELKGDELENAKALWLSAANSVADVAQELERLGIHKQVGNRIMEPFTFISTIVTATEWDNFFELRAHPDAQPEFHELATRMAAAIDESTPTELSRGDWHLPYISENEKNSIDVGLLVKLSAARCARVSYLTHDGKEPNVENDLKLYDRLVGSVPLHASPIEHQATPLELATTPSRNFRGWEQYRAMVEDNTIPWT